MSSSKSPAELVATLQRLTANGLPKDDDAHLEALDSARKLVAQLEKPMETVLRVAWIEFSYATCLKIGIDIGLFDILGKSGDGSKHTTEELAKRTKTDPGLLQRVLRVLASMYAIAEVDAETFAATDFSTALRNKHCSSAIEWRWFLGNPIFHNLPLYLKKINYQNPSSLLESNLQDTFKTKLSAWEWLSQSPENVEMFSNHMAGYTSHRGTWHDLYPIKQRLLDGDADIDTAKDFILADIGGGQGHDLKRFAAHIAPTAQRQCLLLQDLPDVAEEARVHGYLPPTVQIVPVDLRKESPMMGARAYYMHSILHDWPDSDARKILIQMHPALSQKTPDGRVPKLLLNEVVIPQRGLAQQPAAVDIIMLAAFSSHERSEEQWAALLESAGYKITGIYNKAGIDDGIIEAEAVNVPNGQ